MSKEAMKLALEALQKIYIAPEHEDYIKVWWPACEQAITALRKTLAEQPAQQEVDWEKLYRLEVKKKDALAAKYERDTGKKLTRIIPMAEQPAQQEPVAGLLVGQDSDGRYVSIAAKAHADTLPLGEYKLYTSPPAQRKPLTEAQLEKGRDQTFSINNPFCPCDSKTFRKVARWVEAAHGIKENT